MPEATIEDQLKIYPNPVTKDIIWFDVTGIDHPESLTIFNAKGEIVYNRTLANNEIFRIDLELKPGIYITRVIGDSSIFTKKFIVI